MITGALLRDAVVYASACLDEKQQEIDALNVFPVPDGDTGTNMSMTFSAAAREVALFADDSELSAVAERVALSLLHGARGNSGVILSLIFRGFAKELQQRTAADGAELAAALKRGTEMAYKAVMKPVEGTILTVIRAASEAAKKQAKAKGDPIAVFRAALRAAREALADTPNLLPVLKKANVVDAGGQGLVVILEAMLAVFEGGKRQYISAEVPSQAAPNVFTYTPAALAQFEQANGYLYCTECSVQLPQTSQEEQLNALRDFLMGIGDSLVFIWQEEFLKIHVHTNAPDAVLQAALRCGALTQVKIENMQIQHSTLQEAEAREESAAERDCGLVAVAAGAGLTELFYSLGADAVVSGGQTMNPSTQELLEALRTVRAKHIFVLPNNPNIRMAAKQAAELAGETVYVLDTDHVPQGIAAALALDEAQSVRENAAAMWEAASLVQTGYVTFAAQDRQYDELSLKQGDIIGMVCGNIVFCGETPAAAALALVQELFTPKNSMVTLYYGEGITREEAEETQKKLYGALPSAAEVILVDGGQPVYYYILAVE